MNDCLEVLFWQGNDYEKSSLQKEGAQVSKTCKAIPQKRRIEYTSS